jgi:hypothetical protein
MAIVTPVFRVSYPNVFKPKRNDLSGKDEYSLVALFDKGADLTALKKEVDAVLTKKFGEKSKWPKNLRLPFRDQGERIDAAKEKDKAPPAGYEAGAIMLNLKSEMRPGIVGPDMQEIIDTAEFYAGCYARASISVYAYDNKGNRGASFGLQYLQKMKDGDTLSGRPKLEDAFEAVASADGVFD